jgi:hypothetical protein
MVVVTRMAAGRNRSSVCDEFVTTPDAAEGAADCIAKRSARFDLHLRR